MSRLSPSPGSLQFHRALPDNRDHVFSSLQALARSETSLRTSSQAAIGALATARGWSGQHYLQAVRRHFRQLARCVQPWMRIHPDALASALRDRRFKNLFELRDHWFLRERAQSWVDLVASRASVEFDCHGIPLDAPGSARPRYGYWSSDPDGRPLMLFDLHPDYGSASVRFNAGIRERSTITFWLKCPQLFCGADPINAPTERTWPWPLNLGDPLAYDDFDLVSPMMEAQFHNTLTPAEVKEVVFATGEPPAPALATALGEQGIPWRVQDHETHFGRLRAVLAGEFALGDHSPHGPAHWSRVEQIAIRLTTQCDADPVVVRLFALLHDAQRHGERVDLGHGHRAAERAEALWGNPWGISQRDVSRAQLEVLKYACTHHSDLRTSEHPTVGACWDADRLARMGPCHPALPGLLSTAVAREPETARWAAELPSPGGVNSRR